ncbi:MAG: hypothetical protein HY321_13405 [Armatimonadetes bacterium]|nr:hypothetical protein [Armatimonadota bacterium]
MDDWNRTAMDRKVAFWQRRMPGQILAVVSARSSHAEPSRWERYCREHDLETERIGTRPPLFEDPARLFEMCEARVSLPEESSQPPVRTDTVRVPGCTPTVHFGEGIHGAFFGGKVRFSSSDVKTESVCDPVITDWAQLDGLRFDESHPWVQRVLGVLRYFVERGFGRLVLAPYCTIDGLNFALFMRGASNAFMDTYDSRPQLRRLFDLGFDTTIRYWDLQRAIIEESNEAAIGHPEFARLGPFHAKPGLSVDAYGLCRVEVFEEIGREHLQRLVDYYGGGFLHIHSRGHHLAPAVGKVRGITQIDCGEDPGWERAFPKIRYFRDATGDTPLMVRCTLEEFRRGLRDGSLPGGVTYYVQGACETADEANRLMDRVREYRVSG